MYCARCGHTLQMTDHACPNCGLDLNGSGAIRMTKGLWSGEGVPGAAPSAGSTASATQPSGGGGAQPSASVGRTQSGPGTSGPHDDPAAGWVRTHSSGAIDPTAAAPSPQDQPGGSDGPTAAGAHGTAPSAASAGRPPATGRPRQQQPWEVPQLPDEMFGASPYPATQGGGRSGAGQSPSGGQADQPTQLRPGHPGQPGSFAAGQHQGQYQGGGEDDAGTLPRLDPDAILDEDAPMASARVHEIREERTRRRNRIAIVVLGLAVLVMIIPLAIVVKGLLNPGGPSSASSASATPSAKPTSSTSASARPSQTPAAQPSSTPTPSPSASTPPPYPSGTRECQGAAAANTTSCPFAENVAKAVDKSKTGQWTVKVFSPTTKREYQMTCTRSELIVCTGGNSAVVYIRP